MEYSKEDLMEAKKQILGVGENMGTEESKKIWEENAQFWDNAMGDESNEFHREVVRPKVTELLSPNPADYILDIACGNGNYSSYLAQRGASVVAFDYSKKMIELAKRRQSQYAKQIEFCVADATDRKSILELKRNRAFTKAVSNMAIMDITDIEPLLMAVYELLQEISCISTSLSIARNTSPFSSIVSVTALGNIAANFLKFSSALFAVCILSLSIFFFLRFV
ncbi:Trans-aconitate methyltransferase [uncultured Roseburia sp.]|nr:Trans-aconitate methyltransferase [uncultured Roseburia sp.]